MPLRQRTPIPPPGSRFGSWTVVGDVDLCPRCSPSVMCRCDCGTVSPVDVCAMLRGERLRCHACAVAARPSPFDAVRVDARFGKLVVRAIGPERQKHSRNRRVWCLCDCGQPHVTTAGNLVYHRVQSCGCASRDARRKHISHERERYWRARQMALAAQAQEEKRPCPIE